MKLLHVAGTACVGLAIWVVRDAPPSGARPAALAVPCTSFDCRARDAQARQAEHCPKAALFERVSADPSEPAAKRAAARGYGQEHRVACSAARAELERLADEASR